MDRLANNTQVSELHGTWWTARSDLWSWLLQVRALPPEPRSAGGHHIRLGPRQSDGAGQLRVDDKLTTARRVAWELEYGSLPLGVRIAGCPDDPAVREDLAPSSHWWCRRAGNSAARATRRWVEDDGAARRVETDPALRTVPSNHSPHYAPVIEPTLPIGVTALVTAA